MDFGRRNFKLNDMKQIFLLLLALASISADAQVDTSNFHWDPTQKKVYVNVSRVYWTQMSIIPTSRLYINAGFDFDTTATINYWLKDTTNYNDIMVGGVILPVNTNNLDSAKIQAVEYLLYRYFIDRNGNPILTPEP